MRTATIRDVKQNLSRYIRNMDNRAIVITKNGKPCAGLVRLENNDSDIDDFLMANDRKLVELVHKSARSGFVSSASLKRELAADLRRAQRNDRKRRMSQ
ncbi:MAG: hypothetical protein A3G34_02230 [Candidatus Lindowbacteria bacterium RIFCSPLOWO2_12_FULL_62_27]|nr:MAG: hypothetical protein A3G34_02230 [Candidatus Lindowbacteria bacterium RIFCSPLOWO2_12_FULL_62_27]OGH61217.1 MAG: hypothetical protein A3I06_15560 [Candidatus Lindowbacteria bacterium RIFCSPLOWO2_02_FULL_62_12]